MNSKAEIALANFRQDYDAFIIACSELDESDAWDADELGPAATYFESDVFGVILQVMSADGVFEHSEAEVLNALFDTAYTPRELNAMYHSIGPVLKNYLNDDSDDALTMLQDINPKMAEDYRSLLLEASRIVSLSDGVDEKSERMLIAQFREALS